MVLLLAVSAAYSANFSGLRDAFPPPSRLVSAGPIDRDATTVDDSTASASLRSFPWWAPVKTFSGTGPTTTAAFTIDDFALQWRAVWTCESGHLLAQARTPAGETLAQPLADSTCPREGTGFSVDTGEIVLEVEADEEWEIVVEQQVDVPLVEPLIKEMKQGRVIASGEIYDMDRRGNGLMSIYKLKDGSMMLRLEDFFVSPNVDLEVDLSVLPDPKTTEEFTKARYEEVSMMPVTTGSINYEIPDSIDLSEWRSVVIWCEPLHIAYAGATLSPTS